MASDSSAPSRDFLPTASLDNLRRRARLLAQLRDFFTQRGFWEVETPLLSADTVVDRHLEPMRVESPERSAGTSTALPCWLQTSPEFGMKRLLAAGAEAIYQITKAFRCDELGPRHNPEFTIVEWYRTGDDLWAGMELLAELSHALLPHYRPCERLTYHDAFQTALGLNPHRATLRALQECAEAHVSGYAGSSGNSDRDEWLNLLLAEVVEPQLATRGAVILYDYPASQAALAQLRVDARGDEVASRFELYVAGIELANGYHELLDAEALAARQQLANQQRRSAGLRALPEENCLLAAMRHGLPACTGVALGFDRLAMLALQAASLRDVMAFPFDRA